MRHHHSTLKALSLAALIAGGAHAEPLDLVGEARLDFMFWSIYDSRLYAPGGEYEPGVRPLRLEVEYLRDIDSRALVRRTRKEWEALGIDAPAREQWLETLRKLWPDISRGDVLALQIDERGHSTFFHNDESLGTIDDQDFGEAFAAIWLSPDTSRPEIRLSLLGRNDD